MPERRQVIRTYRRGLHELLTSEFMHGCIITFECGLVYRIGQGWEGCGPDEAHARLRSWWYTAQNAREPGGLAR